MEVTLSWFEVFQGAACGVLRQIENLRAGRRDAHGFSGDGWGLHVDGALAEMAAAKASDRYWEAVVSGDPRRIAGDVGLVQVRSTRRVNGSLIVHPTDPDEATFVLVVGTAPSYRVVGSILGREAKDSRWWRTDTGRPAYFVPQEVLR